MSDNVKLAIGAWALAALCLGGCAAKSDGPSPHAGVVSPHLLFDLDAAEADTISPEALPIMPDDHWQMLVNGRNDGRLSGGGQMPAGAQWLEIRQRDFQRTVNGRPREYSTTYTTTLRRAFIR